MKFGEIKENYPQVYLEECKHKIKKIQMSRFINAELYQIQSQNLTLNYWESENLVLILNKTFHTFFIFVFLFCFIFLIYFFYLKYKYFK